MLVDAPPKVVVDACAGAGGKTLQLAAQMKNRGELFALDISHSRMEELRKRARRAGAYNIRVRLIPAEPAAALGSLKDLVGRADRVLIDAPCSGTGTLRRNPDARYRLQEGDLELHVERQRALLDSFSELVRPGGRLIYGTCSLLRQENEEILKRFLESHAGFRLKPAVSVLGEALSDTTDAGFLKLAPHRQGTDGFFGAILERAPIQ
jgi:16S rRNA (cytosine967-C5)-methyltransferase